MRVKLDYTWQSIYKDNIRPLLTEKEVSMAKSRYSKSVFRKVLVPFIHGKDCTSALSAASADRWRWADYPGRVGSGFRKGKA